MNSIVLKGNIAGDILRNPTGGHPLLRVLLFSSHPRPISGLRIVMLDGKAKGFYDALKKGSEIGVIGHLVTRKHDGNFVAEVEARNLILLSNFPWGKINTQGVLADQGNGRASD